MRVRHAGAVYREPGVVAAWAFELAVRAHRDPRWIRFAGPPVALAFYVRPTNAAWRLAITLLVFARHRRQLWAFFCAPCAVNSR